MRRRRGTCPCLPGPNKTIAASLSATALAFGGIFCRATFRRWKACSAATPSCAVGSTASCASRLQLETFRCFDAWNWCLAGLVQYTGDQLAAELRQVQRHHALRCAARQSLLVFLAQPSADAVVETTPITEGIVNQAAPGFLRSRVPRSQRRQLASSPSNTSGRGGSQAFLPRSRTCVRPSSGPASGRRGRCGRSRAATRGSDLGAHARDAPLAGHGPGEQGAWSPKGSRQPRPALSRFMPAGVGHATTAMHPGQSGGWQMWPVAWRSLASGASFRPAMDGAT